MDTNTIVYDNGEIALRVSLDNETIWLTQKQISELFEVTVPNVSMHIKAIYKEKELTKEPTVKKYLIVQQEGNRKVTRDVEHYNLDVIISVGYRVNSLKATKFRQWATTVLKGYITNGYSVNTNKITFQKFENLELDMIELKKKQFNTDIKIDNILNVIKDKSIKPTQGIFYNGQIFDAYSFIANLIREAKKNIILIDNFIDDSVLTLFSKNQDIDITIYTNTISKQLLQDVEKYNAQYRAINIKNFKDSHDRFFIIDNTQIYHIGASLKDLGKKWFAFSKMDMQNINILEKLQKGKQT
jgi:prophage antirepressor-like protein